MGAARRLLGLWLAAALALGAARGCLHCDPAFAARFASYRPRLSRKAWGLGDVPAAGRLLRGWAGDTVRGLRLSIPAEIPLDKLHEIAAKVYEKLDIMLSGKRTNQVFSLSSCSLFSRTRSRRYREPSLKADWSVNVTVVIRRMGSSLERPFRLHKQNRPAVSEVDSCLEKDPRLPQLHIHQG
ncbi:unnamed protein product [Eretmochelys imbricata]